VRPNALDFHYRFVNFDTTMKKKEHPLDEPGQQWSWKITLTIICAVVSAIIALYLFRVF
jgi:hypothetical protein